MFLYEITNTVNGKGYVGITKGRVKHRWWSHKDDLKKGNHGNKWLQNSYNKHGVDAFEYKVRFVCKSKEELSNLEKKIIKEERHRLYNIKDGGYDAPPVAHTEEAKIKIGNASKIPIVGMSVETGEMKEYACAKDAKLDGFNPKNISKCCHMSICHTPGRVQQAISSNKWVWMHKVDFNINEMNRRREMAKNRGKNDQSRPVMGKSLKDGSVVVFKSAKEAGREMNGHGPSIGQVASGTVGFKIHRGHVWVFTDNPTPTILLEERYFYALPKYKGVGSWKGPKISKR